MNTIHSANTGLPVNVVYTPSAANDGTGRIPQDLQSASDLKGFASREWLSGLLDPAKITSSNYFGGTAHREGKMARFVKKDVAKYSAEQNEIE